MTETEKGRSWLNIHEGWIVVTFLMIAMFGSGWVASQLAMRLDYQNDALRIDRAYAETIKSKDETISEKDRVIAQLSTSTATASNAASKAVGQAIEASSNAANAAQSAQQAVTDRKSLGKLR